jgi:hypothetical protein
MICLFLNLPFTSAQTQTLFSWSGQLQPFSIDPSADYSIGFNAHLNQQDVVQLTVNASNTVHVEICSSENYRKNLAIPYSCYSASAICWNFGVSATIASSCNSDPTLKHPLRVNGDTLTFEAPTSDTWYFIISNDQSSPREVTVSAMLVGQGQQTENIVDNPLLQELRGNLPQFAIGLGIGIGIGIILLTMILKRRDSQARN